MGASAATEKGTTAAPNRAEIAMRVIMRRILACFLPLNKSGVCQKMPKKWHECFFLLHKQPKAGIMTAFKFFLL